MPTPREGETRQEFMGRCVRQVIREGKPVDQAVAQCSSMWDQHRRRQRKSLFERISDWINRRKSDA